MSSRRANSPALWALLPALLVPGLAAAQQAGDKAAAAQALFDEGRRDLEDGKVEAACRKFAASNDLDPGAGTLLNLGACYETLGRSASAWAAFVEAQGLAARAGDERRARVAGQRAATLASKLSRLHIVTPADAPAGLVVTRDGTIVPAAGLTTAAPVDPGEHVVEAQAPGRTPWSTHVNVPPDGTTVEVPVPELAPLAPAAEELPPPPPPEFVVRRRGRVQRLTALVLGGAAVVGLGVGTYFGLSAKSDWDDAQSHCDAVSCDPTGHQLVGDAQRSADLSTAAFVVSGVAAGGALALWLLAPRDERVPVVKPAVTSSAVGVVVEGAF